MQGEIKHLYRSFAFLSSKMVIENGGMLVCKTKQLVLAGGGKVNMKAKLFPFYLIFLGKYYRAGTQVFETLSESRLNF